MKDIRVVLLSGGSGTRLWPLSRENHPKQFLPLVGDATLLQDTWSRVSALSTAPPIVVANEEHRFLVAEQLRLVGLQHADIMLEPTGRNTAPAIAAAAMQARQDGKDPILLVLPSDHAIHDGQGFRDAVQRALPSAERGDLVTFGVVPKSPETGFGYILADGLAEDGIRRVLAFVEKPDLETAGRYLASGDYFWNSGMFMFRASRYLEELRRFREDIAAGVAAAFEDRREDGDFTRLGLDAFIATPSESVDYAVMERTDAAVVLPVDIGWSDVGSWSALRDISAMDPAGNALVGDVIMVDSRNCYAYAKRLLALVGVEDLVVVETDDAVMVAHKDKAQQVREIVAQLKAGRRSHALLHREVHRPWGTYDAIDADQGFQVKRIKVRPGARLSLQSHRHRAEHWVIVRGTARVTRGEEVFEVAANQSTYIPPGIRHRLENAGTGVLELIEVQSGDYLGEDDIVRYDDAYGRS